jgi:hypothetical protein
MIPGQWIKGHQDKKVALDKLPLAALLNIAADKLASEALMSITTYHKQLPTLPWTQCRALLYIDGQPYTRAETFQLRWKWRESEYPDFLDGRWGLKEGVIQTINWAGYRLARNRMTLPIRTFSTKLLIGWLATGTRMESTVQQHTNAVPPLQRCGNGRPFRCPENRDLFQSFLTAMQAFLISINTKPAIMDDILWGIQRWATEEN